AFSKSSNDCMGGKFPAQASGLRSASASSSDTAEESGWNPSSAPARRSASPSPEASPTADHAPFQAGRQRAEEQRGGVMSNRHHLLSDSLRKNIEIMSRLERHALDRRSGTDRISDAMTAFASSGPFLVLHVVWFVLWI